MDVDAEDVEMFAEIKDELVVPVVVLVAVPSKTCMKMLEV